LEKSGTTQAAAADTKIGAMNDSSSLLNSVQRPPWMWICTGTPFELGAAAAGKMSSVSSSPVP
jgi:hypothetical protein